MQEISEEKGKFFSQFPVNVVYYIPKEAISKVLKRSESLSLRLAKGAFSVITLRVVTLKLPFATHCEQHLYLFLNDF